MKTQLQFGESFLDKVIRDKRKSLPRVLQILIYLKKLTLVEKSSPFLFLNRIIEFLNASFSEFLHQFELLYFVNSSIFNKNIFYLK